MVDGDRVKKEYSTPKLAVHGSIEKLTGCSAVREGQRFLDMLFGGGGGGGWTPLGPDPCAGS